MASRVLSLCRGIQILCRFKRVSVPPLQVSQSCLDHCPVWWAFTRGLIPVADQLTRSKRGWVRLNQYRRCGEIHLTAVGQIVWPGGKALGWYVSRRTSVRVRELRSCVKEEVDVLGPYSPYGFCGRKASLNLN